MKQVKYLTKEHLVRLNNHAIKHNSNRAVATEYVNEIAEDLKIPITFVMPHNDVEWRLKLTLTNPFEPTTTIYNADGEEIEERPNWNEVWLDIPFKEWEKIPEMAIHD